MTTVDSRIAVVGAGVFGLSTALHLKRKGYKDVTVFDYQQYDENAYDPSAGCDSASSDVNKIYRCSYGNETEYQDLAFSGRPIWLQWNKEIASTPADQLPKGLTPNDQLFIESGFLRLSPGTELSDYDKECLAALENAGLRHHQHSIRDPEDIARLAEKDKADPSKHWLEKAATMDKLEGGTLAGFLDTSAGYTIADKACAWARHLAERDGVKFVLGPQKGRFVELSVLGQGEDRRVTGLKTADGISHAADVVVVAGGGWTPSLIPEVANVLQATAGSVATISLPKDRQDLWDRFSPERFPVWAYGVTGHVSPEYGGLYGFPRTKDGKLKIGYRGRKWTNFQEHPVTGQRLSVPKTKYTIDKAVNLPKKAITNIKRVVGELFPELTDIGITDTRLCWYTDSWDNSFIIDYVPGFSDSLFVASGGSGHGFKFLPVLGKHVVNALEKTPDQFTPLWHFRTPESGEHANGIDEGEDSGRNLAALDIAEESDWVWEKSIPVEVSA